MRTFIIFISWFIFSAPLLFAEENAVLTLKGHLSQEAVAKAEQLLGALTAKQLILEVNSNSGELTCCWSWLRISMSLKLRRG